MSERNSVVVGLVQTPQRACSAKTQISSSANWSELARRVALPFFMAMLLLTIRSCNLLAVPVVEFVPMRVEPDKHTARQMHGRSASAKFRLQALEAGTEAHAQLETLYIGIVHILL
jgi:hypothetical protein